jgi:hypothetical protein
MLKWLRNASAMGRLDQEISRLGASPAVVPKGLRERLVGAIQEHIDAFARNHPYAVGEVSDFNNSTYGIAAAMLFVTAMSKDQATKIVGAYNYSLVVEAVKGSDGSPQGRMVKELCQVCRQHGARLHADFEAAISA